MRGLHTHGHGPFCRFQIPQTLPQEGVYVVSVNGGIEYVGKCQNLAERFNAGYGVIHPRNCFRGGQTTNCRINALILQRTKEGARIELWFRASSDCDKTERQLIAALGPVWNFQGRVAARSRAEIRRTESQRSNTLDRVIKTEDVMPIFKLSLEKTYYEKGFFNVTVDFDRYVGGTGPIELVLGKAGRKIVGKIDRSANRNGTSRIMGGAPLRDWFQSNFGVGDVVDVDLSSLNSIRIG